MRELHRAQQKSRNVSTALMRWRVVGSCPPRSANHSAPHALDPKDILKVYPSPPASNLDSV
jgi:hypothetical protein